MTSTRVGVLAGLLVGAGIVVVAAVLLLGLTVPAVPWSLPVVLGLVAAGMLAATLSFRSRLRGAPGSRPYDPLHAARMVVLAKACAHGGALIAGGYGGLAVALLLRSTSAARRTDAGFSGAAALAAVALVAVGLFLERVCRLPPDDEQRGGGGAPTSPA